MTQLQEAPLDTTSDSRKKCNKNLADRLQKLGIKDKELRKRLLDDTVKCIQEAFTKVQQAAQNVSVRVGQALVGWPPEASRSDAHIRKLRCDLKDSFPGDSRVVGCIILALSTLLTVLTDTSALPPAN